MLQCIPNALKDHEDEKEKEKKKNYPQIQLNIFQIEEIYFHSVKVIGGGRQSLWFATASNCRPPQPLTDRRVVYHR